MKEPLVSVIVPTRNSAATLEACLNSVRNQSYMRIELVVVDRDSTDDTKRIARRFTPHIYNKGPERCAQRNLGVTKATGQHVFIIDSDMELTEHVVASCVQAMQKNPDAAGVIIPEQSFGRGFWARCKQLERSFHIGVDWIEAARFFGRKTYQDLGGYNEQLVSGEDWEFSQRAAKRGRLLRIPDLILHNEGHLKLLKTLRKKSYYAAEFRSYLDLTRQDSQAVHGNQPTSIVLRRYLLYLSRPAKLLRKPHIGLGMLVMKTAEFGFGGIGYLQSKRKQT